MRGRATLRPPVCNILRVVSKKLLFVSWLLLLSTICTIDRILVRIRNPSAIRQNMQKSRKMKTSAQKGRKLKQNNNPIRIAI